MQFMLRTLGLIRSENIPKQNKLFLLQKTTPPEIDTITSPPTITFTPSPRLKNSDHFRPLEARNDAYSFNL